MFLFFVFSYLFQGLFFFSVKTKVNCLNEIIKTWSCFIWIAGQKDLQTTKRWMPSEKRNSCCQELQYPEASSDTDDSVFVESDYQKRGVKDLKESQKCVKLHKIWESQSPEEVQTCSPEGEKGAMKKVQKIKCQLWHYNKVQRQNRIAQMVNLNH